MVDIRRMRMATYLSLAIAFGVMMGGLKAAENIERITFNDLILPTAVLFGTGAVGFVFSLLRWNTLAIWYDPIVAVAYLIISADSFVVLYTGTKVLKDLTFQLLGITQFYAAVFLYMTIVAGFLWWRQSILLESTDTGQKNPDQEER